MLNIRTMLACAVALAASISATYAGPCSSDITQVRDVISVLESTKKLEPRTSPELFNAVHAGMVRAVEADKAGNQDACQQALADVKRLLGLPANQTDPMELDYVAAIGITILLAAGCALLWIAHYAERHLKGQTSRAVAVWPFRIAALLMLFNLLPAMWIWSWFR